MNVHQNARLTPRSRAELVRRVLVERQASAVARRVMHRPADGRLPTGNSRTRARLVLAGIVEKPDLTLRAIVAELAARCPGQP